VDNRINDQDFKQKKLEPKEITETRKKLLFVLRDTTHHNIHLIHPTHANRRRNKLRHLAIAQMHMCVKRGGELNLAQFGKFHVCASV
jgi:hypothetical protein